MDSTPLSKIGLEPIFVEVDLERGARRRAPTGKVAPASSLVGQPPIAVELIDAVKAADSECGEICYTKSDERHPDHRVHFADGDAADRLHKAMGNARVGTARTAMLDYPLRHVVVFSSATRVKEATRYLRNQVKAATAPRPLTKRQAQHLVKLILADAELLAEKLRELRERQGWKALGYDSWAACVEGEFGYSKRHADRLIAAQKTREQVGPIGPAQSPNGGAIPESHARELGCLPDDQRAACYQDYLDECKETGGKPTATGLRKKVNDWLADNEPYIEPQDEHEDEDGDDHRRDDDEDQAPADDEDPRPADDDHQLRVVGGDDDLVDEDGRNRKASKPNYADILADAFRVLSDRIDSIVDQYGSLTAMFQSDEWAECDCRYTIEMIHELRELFYRLDAEAQDYAKTLPEPSP